MVVVIICSALMQRKRMTKVKMSQCIENSLNSDFEFVYSIACFKCNLTIAEGNIVAHEGLSIVPWQLLIITGKSFHTECFVCVACNQIFPADSRCLTIDGNYFHLDCFVCHQCKSTIAEKEFAKERDCTILMNYF